MTNISVLGPARSPVQIATLLLRACQEGDVSQLVVMTRDPEGILSAAWDESTDTPDLCEFQTFLRLESERCVIDDQMEGPYVADDHPGGGAPSDPAGGGAEGDLSP